MSGCHYVIFLHPRKVHVLVYTPDIFREMFPYGGKLSAVHANHSQLIHLRRGKGSACSEVLATTNFSQSLQVEEGQADNLLMLLESCTEYIIMRNVLQSNPIAISAGHISSFAADTCLLVRFGCTRSSPPCGVLSLQRMLDRSRDYLTNAQYHLMSQSQFEIKRR